MKKKAHELEFISLIKRDGSGTEEVSEDDLKYMLESPLMKNKDYELHHLSISKGTYIALSFNVFVVKLKQ